MEFVTSQQGIDRIKKFESCRLTAYQDAAGVWTIGYGHTGSVYAGMQITIWLSILENIQRLGVNMPGFLEKYLDELRNKIEKKK